MIKRTAEIVLTKEEIDSPDPIQLTFIVKEEGSDETIDYTITYPKE